MFIVRATALKVQKEKVRKKNWIPLAIAREDDKIYKTYIPPTVPEF